MTVFNFLAPDSLLRSNASGIYLTDDTFSSITSFKDNDLYNNNSDNNNNDNNHTNNNNFATKVIIIAKPTCPPSNICASSKFTERFYIVLCFIF